MSLRLFWLNISFVEIRILALVYYKFYDREELEFNFANDTLYVFKWILL